MQNADSLSSIFSARLITTIDNASLSSLLSNLYNEYGEMCYFSYNKTKEDYLDYTITFRKGKLTFLLAINDSGKLEKIRNEIYREEDDSDFDKPNIVLKTNSGNIYGILSLPVSEKKIPVVLIIPGYGNINRDGNNDIWLNTQCYKMVADSLLTHNIACIRYDKRGVGFSNKACENYNELSFDDEVKDVEGWINLMKRDKRFSRIIIVGHGEGALIGVLAAQKNKTDKLILVNGNGSHAGESFYRLINELSSQLAMKSKTLLDSIEKGYIVDSVDSGMAGIYNLSFQHYLLRWFSFDPAIELSKLNMPVLVLQGTKNKMIDNAESMHLNGICKKEQYKYVAGMDYYLKCDEIIDNNPNIRSYIPVCNALIKELVDFCVP